MSDKSHNGVTVAEYFLHILARTLIVLTTAKEPHDDVRTPPLSRRGLIRSHEGNERRPLRLDL